MSKLHGKNAFLATLLGVMLSGCGFQPLLTGQQCAANGIPNNVPDSAPQAFTLKITGTGYSAYKFRREMEKQLALTPKINDRPYVIKVSLSEGYVPVAYGTDATVSRNQIQATAAYEISEGAKLLAKGSLTSYSSYILNYTAEFSTRSAQSAASERTLINLSEELAREIMLKIRSAPETEEKEPAPSSQAQADNW